MQQFEVLVIGIGNILWADEGFGVRAVESYHERFADDPRVRVIDGGTLGAYLINEVMKLVQAEYTFDNNKLLFYFTADGRIDFRQLVKDLAAIFKTSREL